jgi:hypothetical protein
MIAVMNRFERAIYKFQSRSKYSEPVYVPGYRYAPWKNWLVALFMCAMLPFIIAGIVFDNEGAASSMFTLLFWLSFVALMWGLISPSHFNDKMPVTSEVGRGRIAGAFGLLCFLFLIMVGATLPASANTGANTSAAPRSSNTSTISNGDNQASSKQLNATQTITEAKPISFQTETQYDSNLPSGQTHVTREGVDGIETYVYTIKLTDGKEVSRSLTSQAVTTAPVSKIITVGTYAAPAAANSGSGYINSDGNYIGSPSNDPTGASAQCNDGTYSYSASRRGTCSHHGGVARWL